MALRPAPSQKTDQNPLRDPENRGRLYRGCRWAVSVDLVRGEFWPERVEVNGVVVVKGWDGIFVFEVRLAYRRPYV